MATTLIRLCDPVFELSCRLNKIARNGGQMDYHVLRGEVKELFERLKREAARDPELEKRFQRVETALALFLDFTVVQSGINCADEWDAHRLGNDYHVIMGDEEFFDLLEEVEADSSEEASECLAVFYTCIGLGFTGFYGDQTEFLKQKMERISPRIRRFIESDPNARITPEAYDHTDRSDLVEPPGSRLVGMMIAFAGLFLVVFLAVVILFRQSAGDLSSSIDEVLHHDPAMPRSVP